MFNNKRRNSKYGGHGRLSVSSGSRRTSSRRSRSDWSSSVVGTHASSSSSRSRARKKTSSQALHGRVSEVSRVEFNSRSVDRNMRYRVNDSRTEHVVRRHTLTSRLTVVAVVVLVVLIALGLGMCAYRGSLSSSMALDDESVSNALVAVESDEDPYYLLLAGIAHDDTSKPTASFLTVMRVDAENQIISFLNIPTNLVASYDHAADGDDMLRDAPHAVNEGEVVTQVASLLGQDINHYVRITEEGFVSLVDSLGGLNVTVEQYVDDPTVGIQVLDPGEQTLSGDQALIYVSAKNYTDGYGQRASIQTSVLQALITTLQEKGGAEFVLSADSISGCLSTDMGYDELTSLAALYANATVYTATLPGSQITSGDSTYWSKSSDWDQVLEEFKAGEDMDVSVDTSGVDKTAPSIVVLNGAGVDGYSAQVAEVLTKAGYSIQETGNANSFVYDETLVIYATEDDKITAEAIVQDLGVGRAVSASAYYSLTIDIQVVVGKDWA